MQTPQKIDKENIVDILPLTPTQEGLLFHYIENPDSSNYFEQISINLYGVVELDIFKKAWHTVVSANPALRTLYRWDKLEAAVQLVLKSHIIPIREYDFTSFSMTKAQAQAEDVVLKDQLEKIDITTAPFRITLCILPCNQYKMIISNHHILYDGWSTGILLKDFLDAYHTIADNHEVMLKKTASYRDYIIALKGIDQQTNKKFWQEYLSAWDEKTGLPFNFKKRTSEIKTAEFRAALPGELARKIEAFSRDNLVTMASLIYSAWGILLAKYSGSPDVLFGTTLSDRAHEINGIENCIGLFINTLPLRITQNDQDTILSLLKSVDENLKKISSHQNIPLPEIKKFTGLNGQDDLFDSLLVIENYPIDQALTKGSGKIQLKDYTAFARTNYDLTIAVMTFGKIEFCFIYNENLFSKDKISTISRQMENLLSHIVENPSMLLDDVVLLTPQEQRRLLVDYNNTLTNYPKEKTLSMLFEEQVKKAPGKTAVVFDGKSFSYGMLNAKANALARLLRAEGVKPDTIVGLLMERSTDMIISILGILKAGGAYLPLDTEYPISRITTILNDASALCLVTNSSLVKKSSELTSLYKGKVINLDEEEQTLKHSTDDLDCTNSSADLAYVMYTSGSTGKPKGIMTSHYNISRVVRDTNYISITSDDVILQLSNYAFDGSTFDIFGSLLNGASLIILDKDSAMDINMIADIIRSQRITVFFITTALFNTLVDLDMECLKGTRKILFGGERVSFRHVSRALEYLGKDRLIHVYGPTETTVFTSYYPINTIDNDLGTVPIGKPLANTELYLLGKNRKLVLPGAPGELYIAGDGLARGYLNQPDLTAQLFINNPYLPGKQIYKTGDLVKMADDGNIIFLDRIDTQVKLRGFRIELGEIESHLLMFKPIKEAVAAVIEESPGNMQLAVCLVTKEPVEVKAIKEFLAPRLPGYMIPAYFLFFDKLPLNPNGKIDKQALLANIRKPGNGTLTIKPSNQIEQTLLLLWRDILGAGEIGIDDNFFDLGGHSLKATVLASRIHRELDIRVPLKEIFSHPTIRELAQIISQISPGKYVSITPAVQQPYYPLSPAQLSLYIQQQFEGIGTSYNITIALRWEGVLDNSRLKKSVQEVVDRHEILRTSFPVEEGRPVQRIAKSVLLKTHETTAEEDQLSRFLAGFVKPFDLSKAPLLRIALVKINEQSHLFVLDIHHIIADGICVYQLLSEIIASYRGEMLPEVKLHYKDYVVWQESAVAKGAFLKQKEYWQSRLAGELPLLQMPVDHPRGSRRSFAGDCITFDIPSSIGSKIAILTRQESVTLNTFFMSIYALLLSKYTSSNELVIGSLVAGRPYADLQTMAGMFNNFLPIKVTIADRTSFKDFVCFNNNDLVTAYENQEYPYSWIVEDLKLKTDAARNPLFDTMVIVHNQTESFEEKKYKDFTISHYPYDHHTSKLDFKFDVYPAARLNEFHCILEYNTGLFNRDTMDRFARHFMNILLIMINKPDTMLDEIQMLSAEERIELLVEFNSTKAFYPKEKNIVTLFEEQVKINPDLPALYYEEQTISFSAFNKKVNQIARLLRTKGVNRDTIVGIMVERGFPMAIGLMAVWKSGGAYLPIDVSSPQERTEYMLNDAQAQLLLTTIAFKELAGSAIQVLYLDDESLYKGDDSDPAPVNQPHDLAYVIYTSGSTGKPKGVMIEHQGLVNRLWWMQENYPIGNEDVILQKTPYTFDVSVWELFWWSITGAGLCFLKPGGEKDPEAITNVIEKYKVTTIHFVPSMLGVFLNYTGQKGTARALAGLKQVFASGEALQVKQVSTFYNLFASNGTKLINLYGPTEATVDVSFFNCYDHHGLDNIPIGRPINNTSLYILNSTGALQPVGVAGELYIGGCQVARGYLNRKDLTEEKFIANPYQPGERLYRTGDLARWKPDGNVEYLGRMDNQVKIRGFRIELGEIEFELLQHNEIHEAAAITRQDKDGNQFICAFLAADREFTVQQLREFLSVRLPEYMIPSYFMMLNKLPVTPNGKLDRKALPAITENIKTGVEYQAPTDEIEAQLAKIWQEVLGIDTVGINDNFFALGGHSLKAAYVITRIQKVLGVTVPLNAFFNNPIINALASVIRKMDRKYLPAIARLEERSAYPASCAQKRLFILNHLEGSNTAYNLPSAVIIEGKLDHKIFSGIFDTLLARHETLRTSFMMQEDEVLQVIHDQIDFSITFTQAVEDDIDLLARKFIKPFNLSQAPLLRVELVQVNPLKHLLLFDMHHIAADGVSSVILVNDFITLYEEKNLPALSIRYRDFSVWQNNLFASDFINKQKEYWLDQFKGEIPVLNLPYDFPRPVQQSPHGKKQSHSLGNRLSSGLKTLSAETDTTLYMLLLAAYNTLLYLYSGQEDIVIGSPAAGRQHPDVEKLIGMFVNTLALRNYPEGAKSFREFLSDVKENVLDAFTNQDYQFENLVSSLVLPRDLSRSPLFDVMFVLQNMGIPPLKTSGLSFLPYNIENNISRFDLTFEVVEQPDDLLLNVEYSTTLFKETTINRIVEHFKQILLQVIANPDVKLAGIDYLSDQEKKQLLVDFNSTKAFYPEGKSMVTLFEEQVKRTPDQPAVYYGEQTITYDTYNRKVNQLARLLRSKGVSRQSVVGLIMERGFSMAIGLMAVWKAGGAYLPIDPGYPCDRTAYMLEDAEALLILTTNTFKEKTDEHIAKLCIDDESLYSGDDSNPVSVNQPHDLAYVIYTSGSTGKPKGVMIEHQSIVNRLWWMQESYPIGERDVILQKTPYTFDVSVWELFWWSITGAGLCFLKPGGEKDPEAIVDAVEKYNVTTIHFVPSMLSVFLNYIEQKEKAGKLVSLKHVFASGEALQLKHANTFNSLFASNKVKLINLYGPTEATVDVSVFDCSNIDGLDNIPIGRPINNTSLYILNSAGALQPVGVAGELYIGGCQVARGYLNRKDLTAEKFTANPFQPNGRLYKTGDLAMWKPDGNIEYLGRLDNQVKVRGFRIELGEIEAELLQHDEIQEAVCVARDNGDGNQYLCAYLAAGREFNVQELREHLSQRLPDYMIPSYFMTLEKLPLTPNGKIDRKALPALEANIKTSVEYKAPADEIEAQLAIIWQDVLGINAVGVNDKFFELGGYSILLIQMHSKVDKLFPGKVKITDCFTHATIAQLAAFIKQSGEAALSAYNPNPIIFPDEYFLNDQISYDRGVLKFTLEKEMSATIKQTTEKENILLTDFLIAAFGYLLAHISGKMEVEIQTNSSQKDKLLSIAVDCEQISTIHDLVKDIAQKRRANNNPYTLTQIQTSLTKKNRQALLVLFYERDFLSSNIDLINIFDIIFEFDSEGEHIICEYNYKQLQKEKIKELLSLYGELIRSMIKAWKDE